MQEHSPLEALARPERSGASLHPLLTQGSGQLAGDGSSGGRHTLAAAQAEGCSVQVTLDRPDEVRVGAQYDRRQVAYCWGSWVGWVVQVSTV